MIIKLRIEKYSQIFNRVSTGHSGLKNVIIVDQIFSFPTDGYNLSFINIPFHMLRSERTSYQMYIRFQNITVFRRVNGSI
jgi:hypothetical protein